MPMIDSNKINWDIVLQKEKQLDFFLNITIPAAKQRNDTIPHTLIICRYSRLTKYILDTLAYQFSGSQIKVVDSLGSAPGDLAAMLTSTWEGSILCLKDGRPINKMKKSSVAVLQQALAEPYIEVKIGKGPSAKAIRIDLPHFALVACYESPHHIRAGIKQCFECVLEISSLSDFDICTIEANASAYENNMILEDDAVSLIAAASNGDFRKAHHLVLWIRDYMLVNNEQFNIIPADYVSVKSTGDLR